MLPVVLAIVLLHARLVVLSGWAEKAQPWLRMSHRGGPWGFQLMPLLASSLCRSSTMPLVGHLGSTTTDSPFWIISPNKLFWRLPWLWLRTSLSKLTRCCSLLSLAHLQRRSWQSAALRVRCSAALLPPQFSLLCLCFPFQHRLYPAHRAALHSVHVGKPRPRSTAVPRTELGSSCLAVRTFTHWDALPDYSQSLRLSAWATQLQGSRPT